MSIWARLALLFLLGAQVPGAYEIFSQAGEGLAMEMCLVSFREGLWGSFGHPLSRAGFSNYIGGRHCPGFRAGGC